MFESIVFSVVLQSQDAYIMDQDLVSHNCERKSWICAFVQSFTATENIS